jgi:hypothetical protein
LYISSLLSMDRWAKSYVPPFILYFAEATVTGITYVYTLDQWLWPQLKVYFLGQLQFK